jgi:8-oxo-dGTP diphosphatase
VSVSVDVAVCIVRAVDGRVLVAERTPRQVGAGYWELPGGKIDAGETAQQAAARELFEEVGLVAQTLRPALAYAYEFKTKRVLLNFFFVDAWSGKPQGREGQRIAWIDPAAIGVGPLLPSNARMLTVLGLPSRYVRADRKASELPLGVRLIRVDEPSLPPDQRVALARRIGARAQPGTHVILTGSALEMRRAGAGGMHSSAHDVRSRSERPPVPLWSVSCADAGELTRAVALGADLALLPPGYSHPAASAVRPPIPIYQEDGTGSALRID